MSNTCRPVARTVTGRPFGHPAHDFGRRIPGQPRDSPCTHRVPGRAHRTAVPRGTAHMARAAKGGAPPCAPAPGSVPRGTPAYPIGPCPLALASGVPRPRHIHGVTLLPPDAVRPWRAACGAACCSTWNRRPGPSVHRPLASTAPVTLRRRSGGLNGGGSSLSTPRVPRGTASLLGAVRSREAACLLGGRVFLVEQPRRRIPRLSPPPSAGSGPALRTSACLASTIQQRSRHHAPCSTWNRVDPFFPGGCPRFTHGPGRASAVPAPVPRGTAVPPGSAAV